MSKTCSIKVGKERCGRKMALKDYAAHIKQEHNIDILVNPIENYIHIHEQVEDAYDHSNAALNNDGVLVDHILRRYWSLAIYDANTQRIEINMKYGDFIDYLVPLIETICRAGRDLRKEAKDTAKEGHPMHPTWEFSDHVNVLRSSKFLSYRDFFRNRNAITNM